MACHDCPDITDYSGDQDQDSHRRGLICSEVLHQGRSAISFKCCYNLWTSQEGDTWAIDYVSHKAVLLIPEERIIAGWRLRPDGDLHPLLDCEEIPKPGQRSSLLQRMGIPLEDRIRNSKDPEQSSPSSSSGARKRRGGKSRKAVQELEGKPS